MLHFKKYKFIVDFVIGVDVSGEVRCIQNTFGAVKEAFYTLCSIEANKRGVPIMSTSPITILKEKFNHELDDN
jgi:hypothetical protein